MQNRYSSLPKFTIVFLLWLSAVSFPQQTSFTENFDGVIAPAIPAGWTGHLEVLLSNTVAQVTTTLHGTAPSQPNSTFIMNGLDGSNGQLDSSAFVALVSPLAEVGPDGATVTFWGNSGNPIQVGTMTNPNDASTFTLISEVPLTYDWVQYTVTITDPGSKYIAFKHANVNSVTPIFIDEVVFSQIIPALTSFIENFDGVVAPALPSGWTGHLEVLLSNTVAQVTTTLHGTAPSQPNSTFIMNGLDGSNGQLDSSAFVALVSPLAEVGPDGATVTFWGNSGNPIQVGTMTNPNDASTFTLISEVPLTYDWVQYTVTITGPGSKYIAFKHANVNSVTPIFIDEVVFSQIIPALTSFTENFDGVIAPAIPAGWTGHLEVLLSNTVAQVTTTLHGTAPSQPNSTFIMNGLDGSNGQLDSSAFVALVSPLAEVGPDGATVTFWGNSGNPIQVGTMTNPNDASTFTLISEVPLTYDWVQYTVTITDPGSKYIAFKHANVNSVTPIFIDEVVFSQSSPATTFQLAVNVLDGWNMVSIPGLHPVDQNVLTWWAFKDPASVYKFNSGYQSVTTVEPGAGYWMKHSGVLTYNTGDEWPEAGIFFVDHYPINANAGWNLIGGYDYNAAVSGITTIPAGLIEGSIFKYSGGYQAAAELVPGYGYWVKLSGAGQIILPSPEVKSTSKVTNNLKAEWGRIIITDNTGNSFTLYAADDNSDLNNFELPPPPPSGMFDIRYGSGRFVEDLSIAVQSIELKGIEYPVKIKVENMSLRMQDETGKLFNAELRRDEEITIANSSVNKLMILSGEIASALPDEYSLEQNYPNPFNPSTTIKFSLPEGSANVKLTIYNALGQKITELVNSKMEAGNYSYQWDAGNVSSGLYIYQFVTENFVSTKKMMLLK